MRDSLIKLHMGLMLVITLLLSYLAMRLMHIPPVGIDDANILFVYSKHFAAGEGLVYNLGGQRVEGFSSMLWMLVTAIGFVFTDYPYPFFLTLNVLLVGGALGYTVHFVEQNFGDVSGYSALPLSLPGLLFMAWIIASPGYLLWTVTSLMETGLWSMLLLSQTIFLLKIIGYGRISANAVAIFAGLNSALILTRPEGIAWALVFITLIFLVARVQQMRPRQLLKTVGLIAGFSALTFILLTLFRLGYFGYPLPNTYYVKMTPDRLYNLRFGLGYLFQFIAANPLVALFVVAATVGFLRNLPMAVRALLAQHASIDLGRVSEFVLASVLLTGTLLPVMMGGDIFGAFRFYQPLWPLFILILFYLPLPQGLWRAGNAMFRLTIFAGCLIVVTYASTVRWPDLSSDRARIVHLFQLSDRQMLTGSYLHRLFDGYEGLPSAGASAAGGLKMGYAGRVIDLMGLNFIPMAHHDSSKKGIRGHAAFNKEVFWQYPPDLLEPTLCRLKGPPVNNYTDPANWIYRIYRGLTLDKRFTQNYAFVAMDVPGEDRRICTYMRREMLADLRADGGYQIQLVD